MLPSNDDVPGPVDEALAEYYQRIDAGERIDLDAFLARHPAGAEELRAILAAADAVEAMASPPRSAGQPKRRDADVAALGKMRYFGDYELLEELGRGGMGVVYKARQQSLNRIVALKMILAGRWANVTEVQRFRREAEAAANLRHRNIVAIHEVGEHQGHQYFTMDFIQGPSLAQMTRDGPLPSRKAAQYLKTVAEAIDSAHQTGTLHRDLKPSNILVGDADDEPHVTDFGLAKRAGGDSELTRAGAPLGTPSYMPPEQAGGRAAEVGPASDVYALGATLYCLVTGRPPFQAETPQATLLQVQQSEPVSPRMLNGAIDRDVETIALKCLRKEPARRYDSARALAEDLGRYLRGEPILARPLGRVERLWRWCKRRPLVSVLAAATIVLTIALLVGAPVWALREARLRRRADAATEEARQSLAEKNFQAAQLAGERGRWRLALEDLDAAEQAGYPDPVSISLARLKALEAVDDMRAWSEEITALAARDDLEDRRGEVLFWRAQHLRSIDREDEGLELLRQALDDHLPPADEAYARALLAETSPEATALLERALELDGFHRGAMAQLVGLLILRGERPRARELAGTANRIFPQDPSFPLALAVVAAIDGDLKTATRWIDKCRDQFDGGTVRRAEGLVSAVDALRNFDPAELDVLLLARLFARASAAAQQRIAVVSDTAEDMPLAAPEHLPLFAIPRCVRRAYILFVQGNLDLRQLFRRDYGRQIELLAEAARIHPDGIFHTMRGMMLINDGRNAEAEAALVAAAKSASMFPLVARDVEYYAMGAALAQHLHEGRKPEHLARALHYARCFVARGAFQPDRHFLVERVAFAAKDRELRRKVLAASLAAKPDDVKLLRYTAENEFDAGEYLAALRAAGKILQLVPEDVPATKVKADVLLRLENLVRENGFPATGARVVPTVPGTAPASDAKP